MGARLIRKAAHCFAIAAALSCASAAQAAITVYTGTLSGLNESPSNGSPGTGTAIVTIDDLLNTMRVQVTFSGLVPTTSTGAPSGTTASHIHAATALPFTGTAGVATTLPTFPGFPLGVTSGTYDSTFDLLTASSYNPAFVAANGGSLTASRDALLTALASGRAYLNIHSTAFPSGEIRAFLSVPEPASWAMMLIGFGAIGVVMRRRPRSLATA